MEELKPCPFCGGKVKIEMFTVDYPVTCFDGGYKIECHECGIRFSESTRTMPTCNKENDEKAKKIVAKRWNMRRG